MNGRQLVVQWIAGVACVLLLGFGPPEWMRRRLEQFIPGAVARRQGAEAARRDSVASKAMAARLASVDSARRASGDTTRAAAATSVAAISAADSADAFNAPADPLSTAFEGQIARLLIVIGVPLALLWNTYRWWRRRGAAPVASA